MRKINVFVWFAAMLLALPGAARAQEELPAENDSGAGKAPVIGIWYDSESKGFYEFKSPEQGSFYYETPEGDRYEGEYEPAGKDNEGNDMYRGKLTYPDEEEPRNLFFKIYEGGKSGYVQYKCRKYPFYKTIES